MNNGKNSDSRMDTYIGFHSLEYHMGMRWRSLHNGEAFWIQTRVLKWAGYPKITTVEQYFDLIESYAQANPTMPDGTENIPFTILCDDWRYFCLENVPQFLDGFQTMEAVW